jgi:hypothetical protein
LVNVVNMGQRSIFLDREDYKKIEEEERDIFIKGVLEAIGIPLKDVWPDISLTVEQKIKLRDLLNKLEVEIIDDADRGYKIYHDNELLAEWFKPKFILREDKKARTLSKRLFYEMVIKTWSVFEEKNENNTN